MASLMSSHKSVGPRMRLNALSYAQRLWEAIDTPVSLGCYLRLKHREYAQLVQKSIVPKSYIDPLAFQLDYQAVKLLSKYPFLDTGINRKVIAFGKFEEAEALCHRTNVRFRLREDGYHFDSRVERVLSFAQRKISHILGSVPSLETMDFSFGPGAAYGVRKETSVYNKVTSTLECTYAFVDKLQEFLEEFPGWIPEGTATVALLPGSQLTFVPKDAKTDRPICIEPLLNGLYQKGVGSWIRKRLKSFGVNLDDQGTNQKLAALAIDRNLATVDFASASDTIAYRLVMDLLPIDWFEFLEVARCPRYEHEGKWMNFHKFTSMGNAYTFELETLIFYALACGCCEELGIDFRTGFDLSVYGDDVIIPRDAFDLFQEVTIACGFKLNEEKSFREGDFFESCGHDYFQGYLVRPYLIKKRLNTLSSSFYAANTIHRFLGRLLVGGLSAVSPRTDCRPIIDRLLGVHDWTVGCIPARFRALGPEGYGDGHLISELDRARPHRVRGKRASWDGWEFRTLTERAIVHKREEWPIAYASYFVRGLSKGDTALTRELSPHGDMLLDIPNPTNNGEGYTVRGRVREVWSNGFCHGQWLGPYTALGLVHPNGVHA